jgi:hypothetical protein
VSMAQYAIPSAHPHPAAEAGKTQRNVKIQGIGPSSAAGRAIRTLGPEVEIRDAFDKIGGPDPLACSLGSP